MKTTKLGVLETFAVGTQHTGVTLEEGEKVSILRDPANPEFTTAIRVVAARDRTAGFLPRRTSDWLAPLMDRGWVVLEAHVAAEPERLSARLKLTVRLTPKGRHILEVPEEPRTPAEELHAEVVAHWPPRKAVDREILSELRDRVETGIVGAVLPETRLLLETRPAPSRSRGKTRRSTTPGDPVATARRLLGGAEIGEPVTSGNLALYPVMLPEQPGPEVVPFDVARARGEVEITEVDRGGTVNELRVTNTGKTPVLLPQGLVVVGGKQDRMIAVGVVVLPGEKRTVPVNCVEAGRWSWEAGHMESRRMATPSMRRHTGAARAERVAACQRMVWDEVQELQCAMGAFSSTEALDEVYEQVDLADARQLLGTLPGGACGFVAAAGPEILGCDLFGSPELLAPVRDRLVEAWALESRTREADGSDHPLPEEIGRLLDEAAAAARPSGEDMGPGADRVLVEGPGLRGSLLLHGESLLHGSLFPADGCCAAPRPPPDPPAPGPARQKL